MASYCNDCGCKVYGGWCTNCNEVQFIRQQYVDQNMEIPERFERECVENAKKFPRKTK